VVRGPDGDLSAIVEHKDASEHTRAIDEINSGVFALEWEQALPLLESLTPSPETSELYLTQIVELARTRSLKTCAVLAAAEQDVLGVNDRRQLARVTAILRERINAEHMRNGVTIVDPASTFIDSRATIGRDATIHPFTIIQGACAVAEGAVVGPFAHLREAEVGPRARIGNFVEVVRSQIGAESRALHLSYLGDAQLGDDVNVGAGTIFANWDGAQHQRSSVGAGTQLGSNTVVVGPSTLGDGCKTGAGAVVVKGEVANGATWVGVPARPLAAAKSGGER
jgi:bifunctional UDP-N-acetylglucosamine pyrophosphorylase/glucosamine-1-phosphate N-acetyltransferase